MRGGLGVSCRRSRRGSLIPSRPRARGLIRLLLATCVTTTGALAPVAGTRLPAPIDDLIGAEPASAQTPVIVAGTPGDCPTDPVQWSPSTAGSECELWMEPCPVAPVVGSLSLRYSVGYPDTDGLTLETYPLMCELRILAVNDPVVYDACVNEAGFVKKVDDVERIVAGEQETVQLCRLLHPAECPAGVQIEPGRCRAIARRPWTCRVGYRPRNEYKTCYRLQAPASTPHPACGDGAPSLVVQRCADYVGSDYVELPELVDCAADYPTADPPDPNTALSANTTAGGSGNYWCEFDQAFLNAACHAVPRPAAGCAQSAAMCLKRASRTGGCSAIANTIRCRALQHSLEAGIRTAVELRSVGCVPCVVLPFSPSPPSCPDEFSQEPGRAGRAAFHETHRVQADYNEGSSRCRVGESETLSAACLALPACTDPPRGALEWSSSHHSQLAVVNAPVLLYLVDVPGEGRDGDLSVGISGLSGTKTLPYPSSPPMAVGDTIATYGRINPTDRSLTTVREMVRRYGECSYTRSPYFELTIRQLWPDNPADVPEIRNLHGAAALEWWDALRTPDERRESIESRGLRYWPDLSAAEREEREEQLTETVACHFLSEDIGEDMAPSWCRWAPSRPGLFRITAGGAWLGKRRDWVDRTVVADSEIRSINSRLRSAAVRDQVAAQLAVANTPAARVGLNDTLTAVLPTDGLTGDTPYSGVGSERACAGSDVRIDCLSAGLGFANYTETHPIGIAVHEVRVVTRAPSP